MPGKFTPPESGNLPEEGKKILAKAYSECRERWVRAHPKDPENKDSKERCAQNAWTAVAKAGYKKVGDKWTKESEDMADDDGEREKLKEAQEARSKKWGIGIKDTGHLTPPKNHSDTGATRPEDYADPVNYLYPIHTEANTRNAIARFQQFKGNYTSAEQKIVAGRIKRAAKKFKIDVKAKLKEMKSGLITMGAEIEIMDLAEGEDDDNVIAHFDITGVNPGVHNRIRITEKDIKDSLPTWEDADMLNTHDRMNMQQIYGLPQKVWQDKGTKALKADGDILDTSVGRDMVVIAKALQKKGKKGGISISAKADLQELGEDEEDGAEYKIREGTIMEGDHFAAIRDNHQADKDAFMTVTFSETDPTEDFSMWEDDGEMTDKDEKEDKEMEEIEKLKQEVSELTSNLEKKDQKIADLEKSLEENSSKLEETSTKLKEYEDKDSETAKAEFIAKIEAAAEKVEVKLEDEELKGLTMEELKVKYLEVLENATKEDIDASEPVEANATDADGADMKDFDQFPSSD